MSHKNNTVKVPAGYRLLRTNEIIREGDKYLAVGAKPLVRNWEDCRSSVGSTSHKDTMYGNRFAAVICKVKKAKLVAPKRRMPLGAPPAGYRFLGAGEVVVASDRVYYTPDREVRTGEPNIFNGYLGYVVGSQYENDFTTHPFVRRVA